MENSEKKVAGNDTMIEVVDYNANWPALFEQERNLLQDKLALWVVAGIEHVGSTAVPNLIAKPVIDIMVPVENLTSSKDAIAVARQLGYHYWPYKADLMHWFCKPSAAHRTNHLHMVPYKSTLWFDRLRFRDALRDDDTLASEYTKLKQYLAKRHRHDREAYTEGKTEFVNRVVNNAKATLLL
ncbi:MAG: GrpB family protein [Tunicatimonas sp.]